MTKIKTPIIFKRLNHWGHHTLVLAKMIDGEPQAITYANRTQVNKKIESLSGSGREFYLYGERPFYVAVVEVNEDKADSLPHGEQATGETS